MKHKAPQYTMILSGSGFRDNHTRGVIAHFMNEKIADGSQPLILRNR